MNSGSLATSFRASICPAEPLLALAVRRSRPGTLTESARGVSGPSSMKHARFKVSVVVLRVRLMRSIATSASRCGPRQTRLRSARLLVSPINSPRQHALVTPTSTMAEDEFSSLELSDKLVHKVRPHLSCSRVVSLLTPSSNSPGRRAWQPTRR